ncbi:MAG: transposase [Gemmataceae bacterium]
MTNTAVVNPETMYALLREIAAKGLAAPATLVQGVAKGLGIELLFLPGCSPDLNLIGRPWRLIKREALYGRYHPTFADFKRAIEETMSELGGKHEDKLASLMTLTFQVFDNVSLIAA